MRVFFTDLEDQREQKLKYVECDQSLEVKFSLTLLPPTLHRLQIRHLLSKKFQQCVINILEKLIRKHT